MLQSDIKPSRNILHDVKWIHSRKRRRLLAIVLVWTAAMAPCRSIAQPQYNTQGYNCTSRDGTCNTYAFYRTLQEQESVAKVAGYFNIPPAIVADLSGLTDLAPNAILPLGQPLYIPLDCRCHNGLTSQMEVPYTIAQDDTFATVASTIYGGLTTYQAMMVSNPALNVFALVTGDTAVVPIFCACPTADQIANGTQFLLTYAVYPDNSLDDISANFNITVAELSVANELPTNAALENYTTLLVPLQALPPIAAMANFPHVVIGPSNMKPTSRSRKVGIFAGLSAGVVAVLLVACLFVARHRRRAPSKKRDKLSDFSLVDPNLALRMFAYKELRKATKNFRRSELLGSGGFGAVYKGTLPSGAVVAVKQMRMESKHGKESFRAEVTSLSHIRHRNLVQLRGWCHEEEQLLLVYDYMCNGNLHELLFRSSGPRFPLTLRHSVLSGVANALSYLHEECPQCVLHRDIKSSNVLLDADFNAYLGDFGLARLIDHEKVGKTTMMAGTFGYLAPEMLHTGKATKESDVYSFGVLVLEVMCGARPLDMTVIELGDDGVLVDKVWRAHEVGNILQVADSRLGIFEASLGSSGQSGLEGESCMTTQTPGAIMEDKKMITNILKLGLLCCNPNAEDRPSTRLVSQLLLLQSWESMEMSMPPLTISKPQARYDKPGFSRMLGTVPPSDSDLLDIGNVVEVGYATSEATTPLSAHPNGERIAKVQTSYVASSALYSGR
ncbi:hypothetical protein KC19_2G252700 [Ceratodon purpureus]|uniref:non-specific serine/threonine protein kinase n=1 Tax=Ceratodon purpureus TaxID=3225 RepID=A0A8T0IYY7_CERPU|nr:hypothetical protein KC19_2G252700 [Ceratodon purpureus]